MIEVLPWLDIALNYFAYFLNTYSQPIWYFNDYINFLGRVKSGKVRKQCELCGQWSNIKWFFKHMSEVHKALFCRCCREYLPIQEQVGFSFIALICGIDQNNFFSCLFCTGRASEMALWASLHGSENKVTFHLSKCRQAFLNLN